MSLHANAIKRSGGTNDIVDLPERPYCHDNCISLDGGGGGGRRDIWTARSL